MKKTIIALMGVFTLVACSEDSYQEADKMNATGTVENTEPQNSVRTVDPVIDYESPYGTTDRFDYIFQNDTDLELRFVAIVNLWRYDGNPADNIHHGFPLTSIPHFTMPSISWGEYTWYLASKMIIIPPHTTETISMSGGTILPVNSAGPTTASGQYFNLHGNPALVPALTVPQMNFLGKYGKFVGFEGYAAHPVTGGGSNLTLRFPIGPQFSNSFTGGSSWIPVPGLPTGYQKLYHTLTKEVCEVNYTSLGFPSMHESSKTFTYAGTSYNCSLYTTRNRVVVLLQ